MLLKMSFAKHSDNTFLSVCFPVNGVNAGLLKLSLYFTYLFIFRALNITEAIAAPGRGGVVRTHNWGR